MGSAPDYSHRRNLSLTGSRWILQPDNLRLGHWAWGMGHWELGVRSEEFGVWSLEFGMRSLEFGVWSLELKVILPLPSYLPISLISLPPYLPISLVSLVSKLSNPFL